MLRLSTFLADVKAALLSAAPIGTTTPAAGSFTTLSRTDVAVVNATTVAPLTGATVTIPAGVSHYVVNPAGTLAALTVVLPAAPTIAAGALQELEVIFPRAVTAITWMAGAGSTLGGAARPTTIALGARVTFFFHQATAQWLHVLQA
jgi:hypothetical protein